MKKALLKDLIYFVLDGPKGLKIQFRLKHDLNKPVTPDELSAAQIHENNVIEMAEKRRAKSSGSFPDSASAKKPADASPAGGNFHNLDIGNLQVVGSGRE